ncbi:hypothetical protein B0H17DRAFT_227903 [Mycena rosella]|uniref:Uncharacterized protein n=1 Tax=Mycena rosella TaxID=1033263 RepID=A0AAD7H125_MYCRO|nr:hypothetical protein B0H17DRAFT_227903 [Mycena rosella]
MAVGYKDRLKWAVYDPSTETIKHADDVPNAESLGPNGLLFSPFYKFGSEPFAPSVEAELIYCVALNGWYKAEKDAEAGIEPRIGGRGHLLLSDIPVDGPEYFDCIVEFYHGHGSASSTTELFNAYFTDYTAVTGVKHHEESWCPPHLRGYMLRIAMWGDARKMGLDMRPGEYYSLRNVRAMTSRDGRYHREAKLFETKIVEMHIQDAEKLPHLKALLERKHAFEALLEVANSSG